MSGGGTAWFDRRPGELSSVGSEENGDPRELLIHMGGLPDWIMLPAELAGEGGPRQIRVIGERRAPCPACKDGPDVRYMLAEERYQVAECAAHGFVWCRS